MVFWQYFFFTQSNIKQVTAQRLPKSGQYPTIMRISTRFVSHEKLDACQGED